MPEAKGKRTGTNFVSKIVKDPKQPPNTLLLKGYLGDSSDEGYTRLYLDPQLSDYVEIPEDAILHTQDASSEQSPLEGTYVWIRRDAEVIHGRVGSDRLKARFLEGRIYQEYMRGAQFGGAGGVPGSTLSGPECRLAPPTPGFPQCNLPALTPAPPFCPPPPPASQPWGCPQSVFNPPCDIASASPRQCSALFPPCPPESRWWGCPPSVFNPPCDIASAYCPSHYQPLCPPTTSPPCIQPTKVIQQCQPSVLFPQCQPPTQVVQCQIVVSVSPQQCLITQQPQCVSQFCVPETLSPQCVPVTFGRCPSVVDGCPTAWGCNFGGWNR